MNTDLHGNRPFDGKWSLKLDLYWNASETVVGQNKTMMIMMMMSTFDFLFGDVHDTYSLNGT